MEKDTCFKLLVLGNLALLRPTRLMRMERGNGMGSKSLAVTDGENNRGKIIEFEVK